ncbi:cytochrome P450 [Periconia macrospinosa]|uniref:Cytochrome P450 n=1 Tax=Periconia macrospinosa TaxID=97972 RepID=A0A2V1DHI1_9PLEO|nr:cytochrome P450 [Periconia macrospinosa]
MLNDIPSFARLWKLWHVGHRPFAQAGSDTLLLASPSGNTLWTCDNKIAKQIYSLPSVQTPVKSLEYLDIWGPTISTVEGQEWKNHRRAVTNGFNPSTYELVWEEAIFQTKGLIKHWKEGNDDHRVSNIHYWAIRLVLHILSGVLFNQRMQWNEESKQQSNQKMNSDRMSFPNALSTVVSRLGLILITPRVLLRLPINGLQEVGQALTDLTFYMESMRSRTIQKSEDIMARRRKSLLESIVLAGLPDSNLQNAPSSSLAKESQHMIPSNTTCIVNFSAATQNPNTWPKAKVTEEYRQQLHNSHAIDFEPRRWLEEVNRAREESFWPFAAGYRKCPGRRFAQVSIIAAVATLLKKNSIRLVVDEKTLIDHKGDADKAWMAVRERAMRRLEDDIEVYLTVGMKGSIPIEIVPHVSC